MIDAYFRGLYSRTMREAYKQATAGIVESISLGGDILDCGAHHGRMFDSLQAMADLDGSRYFGVEWDPETALQAQARGLQVTCADLNQGIPFEPEKFSCVFALSLLEHLLHGCRFLRESHRVLKPGGRLVVLTPNISTYFTAALILAGKMPSTGPHPDSDQLLKNEEIFRVRGEMREPDTERDTPVHRHLVVFSYRVLRQYLLMLGFRKVDGYGFGLYPFPNCMQPLLERIDPYHCHQMVFIAEK